MVGCKSEILSTRENLSLLRVPLSWGGWVREHPPTHTAYGRCESAIGSTPSHPPCFFCDRAQGPRRTHSPLPSLMRCEHELGARGCCCRQWERGARAQRRRFLLRASRLRTLHPPRPTAAAHKGRGGGRGNAPARGRRMHAPDMRGGGSKGQNHRVAEGRSFRARGCDQNVDVLLLHHVRELSDYCA